MPVKVNLPPPYGTVTIDGVAEEATLRQLLTAMGGKSGPGASPGRADFSGSESADAQSAKLNRERMERGANAEKLFTGVLERSKAAVEGAAQNFTKTFSSSTPTIRDFSGILANYSPEPFATAINTFGPALNDQIEIFRTLSQAGLDFGDSILESQRRTAEARLPLEIFGKTVKENSSILAMAYGTATDGANKFATISGKFMEKNGQQFAKLGFSMDELATYNASYMEQQQRSGRLAKMTTDEIVAGQEKYNMELDRMSKATGISRQQLDEANKAASRDARMRLALSKLSETEQLAVQAKIKQLEQLDPTGKMAAGFKDLIAGGGVALTKESRDFANTMNAAGVDASKMGRDLFNGVPGAVQGMNASFAKAGEAGRNISDAERAMATAQATMGNFVPAYGKAVMAGMQDTNEAMARATADQQARLASQDPTRAAAGLDQVLTNVQNSFKTSLIDTKIFEYTASGLKFATEQAEGLANTFSKLDPLEKMGAFFLPEMAKQIGGFLKDLGIGALTLAVGASAAGAAVKVYKDAKSGKAPLPDAEDPDRGRRRPASPTEPDKGPKVPGKAADAVDDAKPSAMKKILQKMGNKYVVVGTAVSGALVYFHEELMNLAVPDFAKYKKMIADLERFQSPGTATPRADTATQTAAAPAGQASTGQMSKDINDINTALKNIDFSKMMIPENVITSIDQGSIKIKNLRDNITTTTSAFKDLNNINLSQLNDTLNKLTTAVEKQSASGVPTSSEAQRSAALAPPAGVEKEMVTLLNQLNMNMGQLVSHQSEAVDYLSKTAKNTRNSIGNMLA